MRFIEKLCYYYHGRMDKFERIQCSDETPYRKESRKNLGIQNHVCPDGTPCVPRDEACKINDPIKVETMPETQNQRFLQKKKIYVNEKIFSGPAQYCEHNIVMA